MLRREVGILHECKECKDFFHISSATIEGSIMSEHGG